MDFITKLSGYDIDIYDSDKLFDVDSSVQDIDIEVVTVEIKWSIDIESRVWGLKGLHPIIDRIDLHIEALAYTEEGAMIIIAEFDEMVLETDWVINDAEIEWESLKRTADFCPNSVEINGVDLTTTVHF
tara:strand:- start:226 stop:612 length:387 start_codon:yes stop_codon:yes gene_type:complete